MDRFNEFLSVYKYPLLAALVGSVLIFSGSLTTLIPQNTMPQASFPPESITDNSSALIKVDIAGAIQKPGVYELPKESRVEDLVKEAGGLLPNVSKEYVSKNLNLSQKISDGQKFYIPFIGEDLTSAVLSTQTSNMTVANTKVNINTAGQSELESLPGVGPATAAKIVAGRPFSSLNDLLTKKVVGNAAFDKIKDRIEL